MCLLFGFCRPDVPNALKVNDKVFQKHTRNYADTLWKVLKTCRPSLTSLRVVNDSSPCLTYSSLDSFHHLTLIWICDSSQAVVRSNIATRTRSVDCLWPWEGFSLPFQNILKPFHWFPGSQTCVLVFVT